MQHPQTRLLEERRQAIDRKRNALLDRLAMLTHDQLTARPAPDRWTLLQVAQHLMLGECAVLQNLPNTSQLEPRQRSLRNRIMAWLVLGILRFGFRANVPTSAMKPDGNTTLDEVRRRWDQSQDWLKDYIANLKPEQINDAVFHHPVSGPLTISQTLSLADVHFESHLRKISTQLKPIQSQPIDRSPTQS